MAIEFHCPHCEKFLSTTEDRAGRKAKCPGCGEVVEVPGSKVETSTTVPDDFLSSASSAVNDPRPRIHCPMCGGEVLAAAQKCKHCGESLKGSGGSSGAEPGKLALIDAGDVLSASWKVYMNQLTPCLLGTLLFMFLMYMAAIPSNVAQFVLGQSRDDGVILLSALMMIVLSIGQFVVNMYLQAGLCRLLLKASRGEDAQVGDLFTGGKYLLRFGISSLLYGIAVGVASVFCLVPGIIVACIFFPYAYVLVAEDSPGIDCFSRSQEITKGNRLQIFVLMLACCGIQILGIMMLCVGLIFTTPLTMLITAVAYLKMTSQEVSTAA